VSETRAYRHSKTGLIGAYTPAMASLFPDLVEVDTTPAPAPTVVEPPVVAPVADPEPSRSTQKDK